MSRFRVLSCLFVVLISLAALAWTAGSDNDAADKETIVRLEHALADAGPKRDVRVYDDVIAADFSGQWADGTRSGKRETIASLASGQDVYEAVALGPLDVRIYGIAAVVTGTFTEKSTLSGRDGSGLYRFTDVWVKRHGRWQVVAFQSVRIPGKKKSPF
jgi:hypothetical protein